VDVKRWQEERVEKMSPAISRQVLHTQTMTLARVMLKQGALVPRHEHENEQIVNVLEGRMRFVVGEGEERVVAAGESLVFPANVPHEAEALEDSIVLDVFSPVREDWLRGDDAYLRR
jgi:quercetin dioxygenase-like cupin family protein